MEERVLYGTTPFFCFSLSDKGSVLYRCGVVPFNTVHSFRFLEWMTLESAGRADEKLAMHTYLQK